MKMNSYDLKAEYKANLVRIAKRAFARPQAYAPRTLVRELLSGEAPNAFMTMNLAFDKATGEYDEAAAGEAEIVLKCTWHYYWEESTLRVCDLRDSDIEAHAQFFIDNLWSVVEDELAGLEGMLG